MQRLWSGWSIGAPGGVPYDGNGESDTDVEIDRESPIRHGTVVHFHFLLTRGVRWPTPATLGIGLRWSGKEARLNDGNDLCRCFLSNPEQRKRDPH